MAKRILLIVSGGIAAYKALELVRLARREDIAVRAVMTASAREFITPLSMGVMTGDTVYGAMFDLKEESEIGHIQLSREADLVVVCPATANIMAKMAAGIADDLATTLLLATDKPVLVVPAMNVRMWHHPATQRNIAQLRADGISVMEPDSGNMACGEWGKGRLPEPPMVLAEIRRCLNAAPPPVQAEPVEALPFSSEVKDNPSTSSGRTGIGLHGKHVLITAGPTHEPIDPVRYIANRSSGKQGFAIARAAAAAGARVTLVAGPVNLPTPPGVSRIDVESARDMLAAVESALPADVAIMVAAVADWHAQATPQKIKKSADGPPALTLVENPDILATLGTHSQRPTLLIGFAAETEYVIGHARAKLAKKRADWIVANDVSGDVMGGDANTIHVISANGIESWDTLPKDAVANRLIEKIAHALHAPAAAD